MLPAEQNAMHRLTAWLPNAQIEGGDRARQPTPTNADRQPGVTAPKASARTPVRRDTGPRRTVCTSSLAWLAANRARRQSTGLTASGRRLERGSSTEGHRSTTGADKGDHVHAHTTSKTGLGHAQPCLDGHPAFKFH